MRWPWIHESRMSQVRAQYTPRLPPVTSTRSSLKLFDDTPVHSRTAPGVALTSESVIENVLLSSSESLETLPLMRVRVKVTLAARITTSQLRIRASMTRPGVVMLHEPVQF